jgi:hypothetical protein
MYPESVVAERGGDRRAFDPQFRHAHAPSAAGRQNCKFVFTLTRAKNTCILCTHRNVYAMTVPWKVARNVRKLKTRAIARLKQATAAREPLQRSTTHYTGKRLDERIGSKAANVESILIQIVGEVSQQECGNCLQNDGPWAKCVRYHDIDRVVTACGNCQWNGRVTCSRTLTGVDSNDVPGIGKCIVH